MEWDEAIRNILQGENAGARNPSCAPGERGSCSSGGAERSPCCSPQPRVRWVWVCPPRRMQALSEIKMGRGCIGPMDHRCLGGRTVPSSIFPSTLLGLILNDSLTVAFPASPRRLGSLGPLVQLGIRHSRPLEKHQSKGRFTDG